MNTENTLAKVAEPFHAMELDPAKKMDLMLRAIRQKNMVRLGTPIDNYDRDPKKRKIVIKEFNHVEEWSEFLIQSKYSFIIDQMEAPGKIYEFNGVKYRGPSLFPLFHIGFERHLRNKGMVADFEAGIAYLESTMGKQAEGDVEQVAMVADAPAVTEEEVAGISDEIAKDFSVH